MLDSYNNNIYTHNVKPERDRCHTLLYVMGLITAARRKKMFK